MKTVFWILTILGVLAGSFILVVGLSSANGAPQEASAAAMALAFAAIPYILARAVSELSDKK